VMRHGQSMANTANIVVSDPINGVNNYGLSEIGVEQVLVSQHQQNKRSRCSYINN